MLPLRWGDVRPLLLLLQVCSGYLMNVNCREMPVEELVVSSGRVLLQLSKLPTPTLFPPVTDCYWGK